MMRKNRMTSEKRQQILERCIAQSFWLGFGTIKDVACNGFRQ